MEQRNTPSSKVSITAPVNPPPAWYILQSCSGLRETKPRSFGSSPTYNLYVMPLSSLGLPAVSIYSLFLFFWLLAFWLLAFLVSAFLVVGSSGSVIFWFLTGAAIS